jgi:hypothetical protein
MLVRKIDSRREADPQLAARRRQRARQRLVRDRLELQTVARRHDSNAAGIACRPRPASTDSIDGGTINTSVDDEHPQHLEHA